MPATHTCDFLIIGAGIAGASAAYFLARGTGSIALLERESAPGYHSTGRSAALYYESYGAPQVRALTLASRAFLERPPDGFAQHPILSPRGALMLGYDGQQAQLDDYLEVVRSVSPLARRLSAAQALERVPVLRADTLVGAVLEPDAMDIDVHALHQGYLRGARAAGATLHVNAEVVDISRHGAGWDVLARIRAPGQPPREQRWRCATLINAAGAWADRIGAMTPGVRPIGLQPKRRSAFQFAPPAGLSTRDWPCFIDVDEQWYVKPDAGMLIGSPANADPVEPHDVQAEELDIASAIDRIQQATSLQIRRPNRVWAGLRSFVDDGGLVIGAQADLPGFVWVAAQGGYGIQSSAAAGAAAAALSRGDPLPDTLLQRGLSAAALGPDRLFAARTGGAA